MPKYRFALKNGKSLVLEGDTMPSDTEVESIAQQQGMELVQAQNPGQEGETDLFHKGWEAINKPLSTIPSQIGEAIGEPLMSWGENRQGAIPTAARYGGAFIKSFGDVSSGMTSPLNLGMTALSGGTSIAARAGAPRIANALNLAARASSVPVMAHGAQQMAEGEDWVQRLMGALEFGMGGYGMKSHIPPERPNLGGLTDDIAELGTSGGKIRELGQSLREPKQLNLFDNMNPEPKRGQLNLFDPPETPDSPGTSPTPPRPPTPPDNTPPNVPRGWLPFEDIPQDRPAIETGPSRDPIPQELPFTEPEQLPLKLGAYKGPGGRFTGTGPSLYRPPRPFSENPVQQQFDFGPPVEPTQAPVPTPGPVDTAPSQMPPGVIPPGTDTPPNIPPTIPPPIAPASAPPIPPPVPSTRPVGPVDTGHGIEPIPPSFFDRMGPPVGEPAPTTQTTQPELPIQQPRNIRDVLQNAVGYEDLEPHEIEVLNNYLRAVGPHAEPTSGTTSGTVQPPFNPENILDEPFRQRAYDPSVGGDARQRGMGTWDNALSNSNTEDLYQMRQAMANDLENLETAEMPRRNGEATGMYKRRIVQAQKKLAAIDAEIVRRSDTEPSRAKIPGGGYTASANLRNAVENITKDYSGKLPAVQTREGIQNALDASEILGNGGIVKIRISHKQGNSFVEIYDNGSGLTEKTLGDKLVEIFSSGKAGDPNATGGKGIGSASYIYGGKYFIIESVAVDPADGLKHRISAFGTPDEFLDPVTGSGESNDIVPNSTPTGTTMKVMIKDDHDINQARGMVEKIVEHSRNKKSTLIVDDGNFTDGTPLKDIQPDGQYIDEFKFKESVDDKPIGEFTTLNRTSDVKILVPQGFAPASRDKIMIHYLNNGLYQYSKEFPLYQMADGVPPDVIVDIHPNVPDLDERYPFINTREDIKDDIKDEINDFLRKNVSHPGISKRKNRTQELYDSMEPVPVTGNIRKPVIYDPGKRLTPQETNYLVNHPVIQQLTKTYDNLVNQILDATGRPAWITRIEGVGIVLDPGSHGIHIPNPTTGKSMIGFNPFLRIENMDPRTAALKNVHTALHEVAHAGRESGMPIVWSAKDAKDPRYGAYITAYMNQISEHGDVGVWDDTGHRMDWIHRLGEVYANFGVESTYKAANELHGIYTGGRGKSAGYSPEIQKLLQLYKDSRGRPETVEDLLSRTGVKQSNNGPTGEGTIPGNNKANGVGATRTSSTGARGIDDPYSKYRAAPIGTTYRISPENMNKRKMSEAIKLGFDYVELDPSGKIVIKKVKNSPALQEMADPNVDRSAWADAANIPRTIMASQDMSAPLRQGLGLIHKGAFWKALPGMIKSWGSEEMYHAIQNSILDDPMFRSAYDARGKIKKSYAAEAGLQLTDLNSMTTREESILSSFAEKVPGVRRSNRAYTAFLNKLRADTFKQMLKDFGVVAGQDTEKNLALAKQIATFVNTASGRGSLGSFETSSKVLSSIFFSPRLLASRLGMMGKGAQAVFSPEVYMLRSPSIRREYLKSLGAIAAVSGTFVGLAQMVGAEVESDPASSDFGKARFGDTRIDPYGGFQQPIVLAQRMMPFIDLSTQGISEIGGLMKSTTTEREYSLDDPGFGRSTRADVLSRFLRSKTNPIINFGWGLMAGQKELSGKEMVYPMDPFGEKGENLMDNAIAQRFIPMLYQDIYELYNNENTPPEAKALAAFAASVGMGSQTYGNAGE